MTASTRNLIIGSIVALLLLVLVIPSCTRTAQVVKEGSAPRWIAVLTNHVNPEYPDVTFTTAHKSKGREWDQVVVENDFKSCYNDSGDWVGLDKEEQNLLYVAVTRAQKVLEYNVTTLEYLGAA